MVKRSAPASTKAQASKKVKQDTQASKHTSIKATKAKPAAAASKTALQTVQDTFKSAGKVAAVIAADISGAVDVAGDLLLDEDNVTPAPAPKVSKKVKKDDKATLVATKVAATEDVPRGKKRKTADDFISTAEEAVALVAGKVGEAIEGVVREFGEASGLAVSAASAVAEGAKKKTKAAKNIKSKVEAVGEDAGTMIKSAANGAGRKALKETKATAVAVAEAASDAESFIGGFESDSDEGGADSSDDESDAEDEAVREAGRRVDVSTLPHLAKDDRSVAARLKRASKKKHVDRGTIFLGRIPHGFYEEAMKEYFNQFGDVTRLRLARNPKTGASRHYGYIEFSSLPVAEIVAETMNNYLLMGHILRCNVIAADDVHPELWLGANKKFRIVPRARVEKVRQDKPRTKDQQEKANENVRQRQSARRQKIKDAGIDYDFAGH